MSDALYERPHGSGAIVRIRRVTAEGEVPVKAVLEVDRRGGELRPGQTPGHPPSLAEAEGPTESAALAALIDHAMEDSTIARLMRDRGIR